MTVRGCWFCFSSLFPSFLNELDTCARDTVTLYFDSCQLTMTWMSNINRSNALDFSWGFFYPAPRAIEETEYERTKAGVKSYISLHRGAAIRTDDFVSNKIFGNINYQIILPTLLRLEISELAVLSANLGALKNSEQIKRFQCWTVSSLNFSFSRLFSRGLPHGLRRSKISFIIFNGVVTDWV